MGFYRRRHWGVLCLLLYVGSILPVFAGEHRRQPVPPEVYFSDATGDHLYRFEVARGNLPTSQADNLGREGCVLNRYAVARPLEFAGKLPEFHMQAEDSADKLLHLGDHYAEARDLLYAQSTELRWETVFSQEVCFEDGTYRVTQQSATDRVRWTFHVEQDTVQLSINESVVVLPSSIFENPGSDHESLQAMLSKFEDAKHFFRGWYGYQWQLERIKQWYAWDQPVHSMSSGCFRPCFWCGATGASTFIGGVSGIIVGCNPATVAGTLGGTCIAAGGAITMGLARTIDACKQCDDCRNPPKEDECQSNTCSAGFECCCNGKRCCDSDKPEPSEEECKNLD